MKNEERRSEELVALEEVSMMNGRLVLALDLIGAAILNGIGLLIIWKNVWDHFFH
ncbi:MAG: hypothetical protein GXY18_02255 [Methanomicrobiales archaeon]|nr:hypothetical protein [Methanomicrobiales archaeon]